jgi:MHS family shikimate/dehydroshikimate transporter-like MFS transporter
MIKVASAGTTGALLEWDDFYIFATVSALTFGQIFFPDSDPVIGTMASFGAFAAAFVSRPLGGWLFGHIGDTRGRKISLIMTLVITGLGICLIGLLPGYRQSGVWAPVLLVILRVVQGIGVGGEYGGASLITIEHAPRAAERGFWGSLPQAASPGGLSLAACMFGLVSLLLGLFLRLCVAETPEFDGSKRNQSDEAPGVELLRTHRRNVVLATGARLAETVSGNMIKSFGLGYVALQLKLPKEIALTGLAMPAAVGVLVTPLYGSLGDRISQDRIYLIACALVAALAFPFFWHAGCARGCDDLAGIRAAPQSGPDLTAERSAVAVYPHVRSWRALHRHVHGVSGFFQRGWIYPAVLALAPAAVGRGLAGRGLAGRGVGCDCDGGAFSVHLAAMTGARGARVLAQ